MKRAQRWIDVSVVLKSGMVHWPDNPPVKIERFLDMDKGNHCNASALSFGSHTGTHMDAPGHFLQGKPGIDRMPFDASVGSARVIEIKNPKIITVDELKLHKIRAGERILFKTRNSDRCWKQTSFQKKFVYISTEAGKYLAGKKVRTVGVDYLSVGGYKKNGSEIHHALLGAGIWLIEGLNLKRVRSGTYDLICLPLRIQGGDGAPARAIVRPLK